MVIDTSALTAVLLQEQDAQAIALAIKNDPVRLVSALSVLETAMLVESRLGPVAGRQLDLLLHRSRADAVPFDAAQAEIARAAWQKYGKRNHPARLSFGDCCAYALAKTSGERLLFKGDDFSQTDLLSQTALE